MCRHVPAGKNCCYQTIGPGCLHTRMNGRKTEFLLCRGIQADTVGRTLIMRPATVPIYTESPEILLGGTDG